MCTSLVATVTAGIRSLTMQLHGTHLGMLLLLQSGVNLASSGTTASVAFQRGNRLWVAAAGDSRAILCTRNARDQWRALPLTIDHRPRRTSERER